MNNDDMDKKLRDFFSMESLPDEELLIRTKTRIAEKNKQKEKHLTGIIVLISVICIVIQTCIISMLFTIPAGIISLYRAVR